jgi:hypothetical protein
MTIDADREALATVLEGVTGVNGHAFRPPAPRDGDAWPRLTGMAIEHGLVMRPVWDVLVWLPADERAASTWIDDHLADLVAAINADGSPGYVDEGEPALVQVGRDDRPVLIITLKTVS